MENLKEEVKSTLREVNSMHEESYYEEKTNELISLFNKEKRAYALEMCKQTVNNIDRSTEWLDTEEQCKQFIPSELQPGDENEK